MKKQKSITQFTVAAYNPVALHEGNSSDRPIAEASSSVNSSNTVFSRIEAAASICFFYFLVRLLFEGGFYLPQFSVGNSSDGTV